VVPKGGYVGENGYRGGLIITAPGGEKKKDENVPQLSKVRAQSVRARSGETLPFGKEESK